jgi:uncharacterized FlaG/YvyC family protein
MLRASKSLEKCSRQENGSRESDSTQNLLETRKDSQKRPNLNHCVEEMNRFLSGAQSRNIGALDH